MGNFGTIVWSDGAGGRQPWQSAAFLSHTEGYGVSIAGIDYFDDMDNYTARDIRQASIGAWMAHHQLVVKVAYSHFNALDMYREQKGWISIATTVLPIITASVELSGCRASLIHDMSEHETVGLGGLTIWIPRQYVSLSLRAENFALKQARNSGFTPRPGISAGIHTKSHRFGAQGILVVVEPQDKLEIRFFAGEEYWIHETFGIHAAISSNPLMLGLGVVLDIKRISINTALVHHPILGWSRGAGVDYSFSTDTTKGP